MEKETAYTFFFDEKLHILAYEYVCCILISSGFEAPLLRFDHLLMLLPIVIRSPMYFLKEIFVRKKVHHLRSLHLGKYKVINYS